MKLPTKQAEDDIQFTDTIIIVSYNLLLKLLATINFSFGLFEFCVGKRVFTV